MSEVVSGKSSSSGGVTAKRQICHACGTGEQVMMFNYKALPGKEAKFETLVQRIAHGYYALETGICDIRVCHPAEGEVAFCLTFTSKTDMQRFKDGPARDTWEELRPYIQEDTERYIAGCLMPDTHSFSTMVEMLKRKVIGSCFAGHDVEGVRKEICKWYPRREEWERFVHWDENPSKYTRNLMFGNECMDVILMCWPAGCQSTIHDHDESSCWAYCIEGEVKETQYTMPVFDKTFAGEKVAGSVGRCSDLRVKCVSTLREGDCAYVTNDIGLHRVSNETDQPAFTMHVYAPGLRKFKIFAETGDVSINTLAEPKMTSIDGIFQPEWTKDIDPDGVVDIAAWNTAQKGKPESD